MTRQKKIFITVFHPFITKNILDTEVFSTLRSNKDISIFLLVSDHKERFIRKNYSDSNVTVIGIPVSKIIQSKLAIFFSRISWLMMNTQYMRYKRRERLDANRSVLSYLKFGIESVLSILISNSPVLNDIFRRSFKRYSKFRDIEDIFDRYRPDVLFSTDIFDESDCLFVIEAKRRGIRTIGMIRSWDNCYSKGIMRAIPDKLITNNYNLKHEAHTMHQIPEEDIEVLGSAQHDIFVKSRRTPKDEFYKSMGLDPDKSLIIFAPAGTILSNTDNQIVDILHKALIKGKFVRQVQFLVRNHPSHPADLKLVSDFEGFSVEEPGKIFNKSNPKDTEILLKDNEHLADELYYADVVVWVATTLPLDAVIFNKPLISIDFDGYKMKPYFKSVRKYHDEDHMRKMLDLGGVSIAENPEQLIQMINRYLEDPSLEKEGRVKIREQQFYKLDGEAGKRIGEFILSEVIS
ncbi:MAG: CDP-glycerol glycerophosphotransferase family protein [Minisyncoccota bacterium]